MVDYKDIIENIESERVKALKNFKEKKKELFEIVRADFLAGGIIAGSLFVVITSVMTFFSLNFPWDFLIGVGGCIIGIIILIFPIISSKFSTKRPNQLILEMCRDLQTSAYVNAMALSMEAENSLASNDEMGLNEYFNKKMESYKILREDMLNVINELNNLKGTTNLTPEVYDPVFNTISMTVNQFMKYENFYFYTNDFRQIDKKNFHQNDDIRKLKAECEKLRDLIKV